MLDEIDRKIIKVLQEDARTSLRKISELVDVSLGTVSNRVKRMEKNGLIKRHAVASDGRKKNIVATELGRKKWLLSRQIALELEDTLMSELSENEKRFLLSSLKQISTYLNG